KSAPTSTRSSPTCSRGSRPSPTSTASTSSTPCASTPTTRSRVSRTDRLSGRRRARERRAFAVPIVAASRLHAYPGGLPRPRHTPDPPAPHHLGLRLLDGPVQLDHQGVVVRRPLAVLLDRAQHADGPPALRPSRRDEPPQAVDPQHPPPRIPRLDRAVGVRHERVAGPEPERARLGLEVLARARPQHERRRVELIDRP